MRIKTIFIILLALLFFSTNLTANSLEESTFPSVNISEKIVLDNGIPLIFNHDESSSVTIIQILINGGKKSESQDKQGLAYLTTRLTLSLPDQGKIQKLMSQATQISMNCMFDFSQIEIACLSENLDETLKLAIGIIQDPLFSSTRIDQLKKWMNQRREATDDDSLNIAHGVFVENFFNGTSYAGSLFGNKESLKSIKTQDVKNFYKENFTTENMIITVVSDMEKDKILPLLQKYFLKFTEGTSLTFPSISIQTPKEPDIFVEKDTQQYLISTAFPLPEISPRYYTLGLLLETLLGKGVNSRLWPLRAQEKLAYNVNARATQMINGGFIEVYLETDTLKKERAISALESILLTIHSEGISEEELETTKTFTRAEFLRTLETKHSRSATLAEFENSGLGHDFINGILTELYNISFDEFNLYLKKILDPDKAIHLVVGPKQEE